MTSARDLRGRGRIAETYGEHDLLWPDAVAGLPYEGATITKLRMARTILSGHPIRFQTVGRAQAGRPPETGIFETIRLPGDWANAFEQLGDTLIATWRVSPDTISATTTVVAGLGAILDVEVIDDEWGFCDQCWAWRPKHLLGPTYYHYDDEEDRLMNSASMSCRRDCS